MLTIEKVADFALPPGDAVVSACVYRDDIYAVTKYGRVYRISYFNGSASVTEVPLNYGGTA